MEDYLIKEYEELRNEVRQKIELHNSLITFMITTVVAALAFSVGKNITLLYLLPFCIIIPISMRVAYYRTTMAKLSAYIIVYLECRVDGLAWETRNANLMAESKNSLYGRLTTYHYYEGMIFSIACYLMFAWDYMKDKAINLHTVVWLIIPFLFVIWEAIITNKILSFEKEKNNWIEKWNNQKLSEKKIDEERTC